HLVAVSLFWFAHRSLELWYLYRGTWDYCTFAASLLTGVFLGGLPFWIQLFSKVSRRKLLVASAILFFMLPWGEWLRLNVPGSREDWSRQIFQQIVFLYGVTALFVIFPGLATAINQKVLNFLDFLSSRKSLDWIFPLLFFCGAVLIGVVIYHQAILVQD